MARRLDICHVRVLYGETVNYNPKLLHHYRFFFMRNIMAIFQRRNPYLVGNRMQIGILLFSFTF